MGSFLYKCPSCKVEEPSFEYTPGVDGHCAHRCRHCGQMMVWDDPTGTGQPQDCKHPKFAKMGPTVLPILTEPD